MTTLDTEIRKLQPIEIYMLSNILNQSDSWKKLMSIIPKNNGEDYLFNYEHFTMIEQAIRQQQRSGAEIFLSEWSTLNKERPTCRTLLDLLVKAQLFRAADYLAVDVLKGNVPERPKFGPAASIDVSEKALEALLKKQVDGLQNNSRNLMHTDTCMSQSLNFVEKPTVIPVSIGKTENRERESDLIKFSNNKSDLMQFSGSEDKLEEVSDLMKFQSNSIGNIKTENFVLQEAQSVDIPLCVQENTFHLKTSDSSSIYNSEITISLDSINDTQMTMSIQNEQMNFQNISHNVIPVVVLEYNEKDKKKS